LVYERHRVLGKPSTGCSFKRKFLALEAEPIPSGSCPVQTRKSSRRAILGRCTQESRRVFGPFANPRGKGPSAPIVNFLWGAFNLLVGVSLLSRHPVTVDLDPGFLALVLGGLAMGIYLSLHFAKVRRDRSGSW
jgi:hypothetical protein